MIWVDVRGKMSVTMLRVMLLLIDAEIGEGKEENGRRGVEFGRYRG